MKDTIKGWIFNLFIERPAKKLTLVEMAGKLDASGERLGQRLAQVSDSQKNRKKLRHAIGIERWGQRRLQVALGEPLLTDEYDGYRPAPDLDWQGLQTKFQATRQETVALARQLEQAGAEDVRVYHNGMGKLSTRGWLQYLNGHADMECKRLK
jgi:hypothetical protein